MKKVFFALLLLIAVSGRSQTIAGFMPYTSTKAQYLQLASDSAHYLPVRDTNFTPKRVGCVVWRTTDNSLYAGISTVAGTKRWAKVANSSDLPAAAWALSGTSGTTPGTNFIGTTDAKNVHFKRNNITKLIILDSSVRFSIDSSNYPPFELTQRPVVISATVPTLRPTNNNTVVAFDIMPKGSPSTFFNIGKAYVDVCRADLIGNSSVPVTGVRLAANDLGNDISGFTYNGDALRPLRFLLFETAVYGWLHTNGTWTFGSSNSGDSASAVVTMNSVNKGVLIPRLTTFQQSSISSPSNGLMVYNTDSLKVSYYNGSSWVYLGAGGGSGSGVTSVATNSGSGITGGTITSTGTIGADTTNVLATRLRVKHIVDSLAATLGGGGGSGLTIGSTTITSSMNHSVLYDSSGVLSRNDKFTYTPSTGLLIDKEITASSATGVPYLRVKATSGSQPAGIDVNYNTFSHYYIFGDPSDNSFYVTDGTFDRKFEVTVNGALNVKYRFGMKKGANVASANDLTLGGDGNVFHITGTTTINAITTSGWQAGAEITLIFDGSCTVKNNTAGGGGTAVMMLAGGADFSATSNDVLKLVYDGTKLYEVSRSVN